jgi:uncharacterized protein (DUF427 family)
MTEHYTYCPYKGNCSYYSIPVGGPQSENAVWTYERPHEAVAGIGEHLACYPARVDAIEEFNLLHDSSSVSTASIFEL